MPSPEREFCAAVRGLPDNPLYRMECRRRWYRARWAFLPSGAFGAVCLALVPHGSETLGRCYPVMMLVSLVIGPLVGAELTRAAVCRDRRSGLWRQMALTEMTAREMVAAKLAPVLHHVGLLVIVPALAVCLAEQLVYELGDIYSLGAWIRFAVSGAAAAVCCLATLTVGCLAAIGGSARHDGWGQQMAGPLTLAALCGVAAWVVLTTGPYGSLLLGGPPLHHWVGLSMWTFWAVTTAASLPWVWRAVVRDVVIGLTGGASK